MKRLEKQREKAERRKQKKLAKLTDGVDSPEGTDSPEGFDSPDAAGPAAADGNTPPEPAAEN
ncbi:MAG TPA: hypothetical protein VN661_05435 [Candidatus Acidoferrales bacterium]|nr:hypothetical protein [Candidatus Acidoferrales bacterium]